MSGPTLAELQALFQARLLRGDEGIRAHLGGGGRFLGVYDNAYGARPAEALAEDFPALRHLLGEAEFDAMARAYAAAHPSTTPSIRWLGRHLAEWLNTTQQGRERPALADLAALEWALGLPFDAAEAPVLGFGDLAGVPPEAWPGLGFSLHPCLALARVGHDVVSYRQAVTGGQVESAPPSLLPAPVTIAVWRDLANLGVRFRPLEAEEDAALQVVREGGDFATLCEALAEAGEAETAAFRAAGLIRAWVEAGWLGGLSQDLASA